MMHSLQELEDLIKEIKFDDSDQHEMGKLFIKGLRKRVLNDNKNLILLILGETGSGKSFASLRLAELLDPYFNTDKIVFSSKDFMETIAKSKKGDCIVYEEVGVNLASRSWWKNFGSNAILQTFRYKNLFLIMNCPVIGFVDKNSVSLVHLTMMMAGIDKGNNLSKIRPIKLETDGQFNFTKRAYPMLGGKMLHRLNVTLPSLKLRRDYELLAKQYKDKLNSKYLKEEIQKQKIQYKKEEEDN